MSEIEQKTIEERLLALEQTLKQQQEGIETLLTILSGGKSLFKLGEWIMKGLKPVISIAVGVITIFQFFRGNGK